MVVSDKPLKAEDGEKRDLLPLAVLAAGAALFFFLRPAEAGEGTNAAIQSRTYSIC